MSNNVQGHSKNKLAQNGVYPILLSVPLSIMLNTEENAIKKIYIEIISNSGKLDHSIQIQI